MTAMGEKPRRRARSPPAGGAPEKSAVNQSFKFIERKRHECRS